MATTKYVILLNRNLKGDVYLFRLDSVVLFEGRKHCIWCQYSSKIFNHAVKYHPLLDARKNTVRLISQYFPKCSSNKMCLTQAKESRSVFQPHKVPSISTNLLKRIFIKALTLQHKDWIGFCKMLGFSTFLCLHYICIYQFVFKKNKNKKPFKTKTVPREQLQRDFNSLIVLFTQCSFYNTISGVFIQKQAFQSLMKLIC